MNDFFKVGGKYYFLIIMPLMALKMRNNNITMTDTHINLKNFGLNNKNTIIPIIKEGERFINFLDEKLNLNLPNSWIFTISKSNKNNLGYFMSKNNKNRFEKGNKALNNINLNLLNLNNMDVYEVIAHEIAHFINFNKGLVDCSSNGYHNKKFKICAEKLYLNVSKGKKGYSITKGNDDFKKLLEEFKPNKKVFDIIQKTSITLKKGSRLRLYMCNCGVKIRVGSDDFKGLCLNCDTEFIKK